MSNKMWEALLDHAKTCVLSGKLYVYYPEDTRNVGVIFNHVYELRGLITGEQFFSADSLSDNQKVSLHPAFFPLIGLDSSVMWFDDSLIDIFFLQK